MVQQLSGSGEIRTRERLGAEAGKAPGMGGLRMEGGMVIASSGGMAATVLPSIRRTGSFTAKADDAHLNAIAKLINSQHRATAEQRAAIATLVARKFVELGIPAGTFASPQGALAGL